MKLLLCLQCEDVFKLRLNEHKTCKCEKCGGMYVDNLNAIYYGNKVIPIGFDNFSLAPAIKQQPEMGKGKNFEAFVIPKQCSTMVKLELDMAPDVWDTTCTIGELNIGIYCCEHQQSEEDGITRSKPILWEWYVEKDGNDLGKGHVLSKTDALVFIEKFLF